ncbi:hypothetical protein LTR85_007062 [Meristemomyces frigidus]|nr:hypothetical protein LTR85_007062 [Meristemomyces frigidus]
MPPRQPHDPFTDAPLRPRNIEPSIRGQTSQQSFRSNASTASARTRQQRDLFAPSLSRRPTSRSTPRVEDEVLADHDSGEETAAQRQRQIRKIRQGSPEGKHSRVKPRQEEEPDIVNRQADGGYLLGISASNEILMSEQLSLELQADREAAEMDADDAMMSRDYFASGIALSGRSSKKSDEEYDAMAPGMMMRLREQAMQRIENERWMFEPLDRYHTRFA